MGHKFPSVLELLSPRIGALRSPHWVTDTLAGLPKWLRGKESVCSTGDAGDAGCPLGQEDPLEIEKATHSSILAWEIPRTEEPGGLQPMKSQTVRHQLAIKQQQHETLQYIYFSELQIHPQKVRRVHSLEYAIE